MNRAAPPFGDAQGSHPRVWVYAVVASAVTIGGLARLLPRWPGLAQEVALPPLDLFADVRALMARAPSIPLFVVGVVAAVVVRAAVLATILGFTRRRFTCALRFYLAALAPALLASGLDFAGRAVLYAYLIWGGLLVLLATVVVMGAAPWTGRDSLHGALGRAARHRFRLATIVPYLVALAIAGDVWRKPGAASQVVVVPLSAALTAFTVSRLAHSPARLSLRRFANMTAATAVVVTAILLVVSSTGGSAGHQASRARAGSLLLVPGVDTDTGHGAMYRFDPLALGYSCRQTFYYSYRGPGRGGPQGDARCPIVSGAPYGKADTTRPLAQLASALRAEIATLTPPVVVITHSQGAWIAWSALTGRDAEPVSTLVMLAPFDQGLAPYPPGGAYAPGAAGGVAVRWATDLGRSLGISKFDPDAPLARELQGTPGAVERLVAHRLPQSTRSGAVIARGDLPLEPRPWPHGLREACPGWLPHASLPTSSLVAATVEHFLDGRTLPACPRWFTAIGHATDAFGAPSPGAVAH